MNTLKLVTPLPISVNHAFYTARNGARVMNGRARSWIAEARALAEREAKRQGWICTKDEKLIADMKIYWGDKRRRDTHNLAKVTFDAFEGVIYEDDKMVLARYIDFTLDRGNPRMEMVFRKFDEKRDGWSYDLSKQANEYKEEHEV